MTAILMYIHNLNPVFLEIGPLKLHWYGLMYILSFVIGYFWLNYLRVIKALNLTKSALLDLIFYLALAVLIGGRVGYALFYQSFYFFNHPLELFFIWKGGMSFHGGLIAVILVGFFFSKKYHLNFYQLADAIVIPIAIGLGLGRIGNFINGELYGRIMAWPWAVQFPDDPLNFRHPSQLYESLKNFFIAFLLLKIKNYKLPKGFLFWFFIFSYGFFRFLIEFLREPEMMIGFLSMGQWLSLPMVVMGGAMLVKLKIKNDNLKCHCEE